MVKQYAYLRWYLLFLNQRLLDSIHFRSGSTEEVSMHGMCSSPLTHLIFLWWSLSINSIPDCWWTFFFPSIHTWSNKLFSYLNNSFWCSTTHAIMKRLAFPLYSLSQLYGMEYIQFLVMFSSEMSLVQERYH